MASSGLEGQEHISQFYEPSKPERFCHELHSALSPLWKAHIFLTKYKLPSGFRPQGGGGDEESQLI